MNKKGIIYLFLLIQLTLYGTFLTLDVLENKINLSNYIKFAVVVLCFLYVILITKNEGGRQRIFLSYAMAFTVVSDIFLLFTDYYFYGVLTFIVAQQLYGMRITELFNRENLYRKGLDRKTHNSNKKLLKELTIRLVVQIIISAILCVLLWMTGILVNSLLVASIFYFISLVTNLAASIKLWLSFPGIKDIIYFAIGMILFFLCDINVGLFNLSSFLDIGSVYINIYNISSILMWTFYGPSQVMIALSSDET